MALIKLQSQQKRALAVIAVIAGLVSLWFLKHYLMLIVI
jgi:hypothetical protein